MKRHVLALLSTCALGTSLLAQQAPTLCGTDQERARLIAQDPTYLEREAAFLQELRDLMRNSAVDRDGDQVYRIPVVFHILHQKGSENISNEQILSAMEILNRDYDKRNADTLGIHPAFENNIADMDIEFRLATRDPNGNCTNGIVRHQTIETFRGEATSKLKPWPREKYMNIWVTDRILSGAAGYFTYGGWSVLDGIMILNDYLGNVGTGTTGRDRALTHEVGHFLSLAHIWGSNNGVPDPNTPDYAMQSDCGDDGVDDTPFTRGWNTCVSPDNPVRPWGDCSKQSFYRAPSGQDAGRFIGYTFNNVTTSSGTVDPTPIEDVYDLQDLSRLLVDISSISANGVSANSSKDSSFAFTEWSLGAPDQATTIGELTGAFDNSDYYQFQLAPQTSDKQTGVPNFTFTLGRNETGIRTFSVRSSANNYTSNLPIVPTTGITVNSSNVGFISADATTTYRVTIDPPASGHTPFTQPLSVDVAQPVTYRIYAWNAEDASGSFIVDSLLIDGYVAEVENAQNYMEYSYCPNHMFTNGQRERARTALLSPTYQRNNLWTDANLIATGTADGTEAICTPEADFYAQVGQNANNPDVPFSPLACVNTNVRFVDNTALAFPETWSWTFQDGVPATSNQQNPTVQFTSSGWKLVTLTVTNSAGSSTKSDPYAVFIGAPDVAVTPYYEGFETMEGTNLYPYLGVNHDANNVTQFRRSTTAGFNGTACAKLNSADRNQLDLIDPVNVGDIDDLITPLFNMSGAPSATLSFRYAYYTTTTDVDTMSEQLSVFWSTDCGRSWLGGGAAQTLTGTALLTNGNNTSEPASEWKLKTITLPGSVLSSNVRFRFRYTSSAFSGNLYIDDIWIGVPVGVEEFIASDFIQLFPNPTNDHFNLQVIGMEASPTEVTITDLRGAVVFNKTFQPNGGANIEISGREIGLSEGMYMLRAQNRIGSHTQKLIMGR